MNEKVSKKVGEAYAFAHVLYGMSQELSETLSPLLGSHNDMVASVTESQQSDLKAHAERHGTAEIVLPKAERTAEKIGRMADMYVGDEWDNPVEVLEWLSFFVGAAIVHWQLIAGSAEAMGDQEFLQTATSGTEYYVDLMAQLREYAITIGKERAVM